jgi:16S rRNA (cytidine1402-2'-O)-methyltransferase
MMDTSTNFLNTIQPPSTPLDAGLYLVATPIGHLKDITLRALEVLQHVDTIVCEDTRHSIHLLHHYGIVKKNLLSYHDHNAEKQRPHIVEALAKGQRIALISDAGTPMIADPGYKLVQDVYAAGFKVVAVPGVCAIITSLMLARLPTHSFTFVGFLPRTSEAKKKLFLTYYDQTVVSYESPMRLHHSLHLLHEVIPTAHVTVARELTKLYEDVVHGTPQEVLNTLSIYKGEVVLLWHTPKPSYTPDMVKKMLKTALQTMSVKQAATAIHECSGFSKKQVYQWAIGKE